MHKRVHAHTHAHTDVRLTGNVHKDATKGLNATDHFSACIILNKVLVHNYTLRPYADPPVTDVPYNETLSVKSGDMVDFAVFPDGATDHVASWEVTFTVQVFKQ